METKLGTYLCVGFDVHGTVVTTDSAGTWPDAQIVAKNLLRSWTGLDRVMIAHVIEEVIL